MKPLFPASISYWPKSGSQIPVTGEAKPSSALNQTSLVLLIHGYNNNQDDATGAYYRFLGLQNEMGTVTANLLGVYWPGANWEGALYYMQAIGQAKKVAPVIANDLYRQANARGYLKIDIVAHSLGCRLTLETILALLKLKESVKATDPNFSGLVIGQVAFMAGAVPTRYLENIDKLRSALTSFNSTLSLFSENDKVLKFAFPPGQTAAGEGFFPVALGRKPWLSGGFLFPQMQQIRNVNADHSDYWGQSDDNLDIKRQAAKNVRGFMPLGNVIPRAQDGRVAAIARSTDTRNDPDARETATRTT